MITKSLLSKGCQIKNYQEAVSVQNIMDHLEQLEQIAYKFNGTRDALHGYNASADFIVDTLRANTNYDITVQVFTYESEEVIGKNNNNYKSFNFIGTPSIVFENTSLVLNTDFLVMGPWGGLFNQVDIPIFSGKNEKTSFFKNDSRRPWLQ